MVTNGILSYTVFTYQCGELPFPTFLRSKIGFSASLISYANHPLSLQSNFYDIACLNQHCPPWTNVVYQISRELGDILCMYFKNNCSFSLNIIFARIGKNTFMYHEYNTNMHFSLLVNHLFQDPYVIPRMSLTSLILLLF